MLIMSLNKFGLLWKRAVVKILLIRISFFLRLRGLIFLLLKVRSHSSINVPRSEKYDKFYLDKSWKSAAPSLFRFTVDSIEQGCSAIYMLSNSIRLDSFCLNS